MARHNTAAELDALEAVTTRLGGFDARVNLEWLDGAMAALLAGPLVPREPSVWIPALLGDTWERTFADPPDQALAARAVLNRWRVLRSQLDPEGLVSDPDQLRLEPLLLTVPAGDDRPWGCDWAQGFFAVIDDPVWGWSAADPAVMASVLVPLHALRGDGQALSDWRLSRGLEASSAIPLLTLADADAPEAQAVGPADSAERLVDDACFAVQDLRLWWQENAPRPSPRQVASTPGRNDPCHCGSGRKFKKCHGAS